jgi:ribosome modulation factor
MAEAAAGQNEREPAPDAVLARNFAKYLRAEGELATAKAEHKAAVKHVVDKGLDKKAAAIAAKILKQGSVATQAYSDLIRNVLALLEVGGSPVSKEQMDLWPAEAERTPIEDRARKEGRRAAFFDKGTDACPYDVTSRAGQEWLAGLAEGRAEVDLIMAMEPSEGSELIKGGEEPFPGDDAEGEVEHKEAAE